MQKRDYRDPPVVPPDWTRWSNLGPTVPLPLSLPLPLPALPLTALSKPHRSPEVEVAATP